MPTPSITAVQLEHLISVERFATFRHAKPDPDVAVALYTWNAQVAGHFAELLHHVEVLTRNAMHEQLTALHAQVPNRPAHKAWFDEPDWAKHHWFDTHAGGEIAKATRRAGHGPSNPRPGKVVAALNFGFWRYLTGPRYEQSFWTPAPRPRLQRPRRNSPRPPPDDRTTTRLPTHTEKPHLTLRTHHPPHPTPIPTPTRNLENPKPALHHRPRPRLLHIPNRCPMAPTSNPRPPTTPPETALLLGLSRSRRHETAAASRVSA